MDDAVDDIVRQFKGVSDGLMQKVVGSSSFLEDSLTIPSKNLSWNPDEISNHLSWRSTTESANSGSDIEEGDKDGTRGHEEVGCSVQANGWHSDNELNSKGFPPRVIKHSEKFRSTDSGKKHGSETDSLLFSLGGYPPACLTVSSNHLEDAIGVPEVPSNQQTAFCSFFLNFISDCFFQFFDLLILNFFLRIYQSAAF